MKKTKRLAALILVCAMTATLVAGCGASSADKTTSTDSSSSTTASSGDSATAKKDYKDYKIALVLATSSKDGGWSQLAAEALEKTKQDYGCQTAFTENVASTDYESTIAGYADAGYDIVIAHGGEFLAACKTVAANYPKTLFICNSAMEGKGPNVAGVDYGGYDGGFMVGTALALISKTGKLGVVEASEENASAEWLRGVKEGAAYTRKDSVVIPMNTGSWDDASKSKQAVDSLASQGVDAVTENCDAAGVGAVQECDALGLYNVGWIDDFAKFGKSCFVSFSQDITLGTEITLKDAMDGKLTGRDQVYEIGAPDGVIKMRDYTGTYADTLTADQKAQLEKVYKMACDGEDLDALN